MSELERFRQCMDDNRPYFGPILASNQGSPIRHGYMQALVGYIEADPLRILEVGAWAGGSTITWAEALQQSGKAGEVLTVDAWLNYNPGGEGGVYEVMAQALQSGDILRLFLHNIAASGYADCVRFIRGRSEEVLPRLRPGQFDLVFIDGSHIYEAVARDIENAMPLVKEGGILCGDDLELQASVVTDARAYSHLDFICDPSGWYHPGVTRAVAEKLGEVSAWSGFWAMRKRGGWEKIEEQLEAKIPIHLEVK